MGWSPGLSPLICTCSPGPWPPHPPSPHWVYPQPHSCGTCLIHSTSSEQVSSDMLLNYLYSINSNPASAGWGLACLSGIPSRATALGWNSGTRALAVVLSVTNLWYGFFYQVLSVWRRELCEWHGVEARTGRERKALSAWMRTHTYTHTDNLLRVSSSWRFFLN